MSTTAPDGLAADLIHEGWNHLKSQRPLAAWASWQRALLVDPESVAAHKALDSLKSASDLPLAARVAYRFREPSDPAKRAIWDERMKGESISNLDATADLFGRLAAHDPTDSIAWFNRGLCLAWMGKNVEAVSCLDRAVGIECAHSFDLAVDAWTLAEILRQGGGAEPLADDLRFTCTIAWNRDDTLWLIEEFPEIRRIPTPRAPGATDLEHREIEVLEWLDQNAANFVQGEGIVTVPPEVLASVYVGAETLRLSSPRRENLERIEETFFQRLENGPRSVRREASPLPIPFLDADVWTFRIPPGLDVDVANRLTREAVEHYFESRWIHRPRHGLGGQSPLSASLAANRGDAQARAKLTAVVRLREQLGSRPSALQLYQGYPFDRLRRRLGLELFYSSAVDPLDLSCASGQELDLLDLTTLADDRLVEAFRSAAGLRGDERTARLATEILKRRPAALASLDLTSLVSPLVRVAMERDNYHAALSWLSEAQSMAAGETARTFEIWRAELFARAGRPDEAKRVYESLLTPDAAGALLALDAGETMLDNGHLHQAKALLTTADDLARRENRPWIVRRARQLIGELP